MKPVRFTNGKWRVLEGLDHNDNLTVAVEGGERTVCECVCADSEDRANAHLIAAAPDLYSLLEEALPFIGWGSKPDGLIEQIEAALAKARGEA